MTDGTIAPKPGSVVGEFNAGFSNGDVAGAYRCEEGTADDAVTGLDPQPVRLADRLFTIKKGSHHGCPSFFMDSSSQGLCLDFPLCCHP